LDGNGRKAWESSGTGGGIQRRSCSDQGEEWGGLLYRGGGFLEKGCLYFLYTWLKERAMQYVISVLDKKSEVINGQVEYWDPGITIKNGKLIYSATQFWKGKCMPSYEYFMILESPDSGGFKIVKEYTVNQGKPDGCNK